MRLPETEACPVVHVALKLGSPGAHLSDEDVVEAHNAVTRRRGSVYLGKRGRPLKGKGHELLDISIRQRNASYLFLVRRSERALSVFKAPLTRLLPLGERPPLDNVPGYYNDPDALFEIHTWFRVGILESVEPAELDKLTLLSNGNPLRRALETSRTTMMLATEAKR